MTIEQKLNDQAELTLLWSTGYPVIWPSVEEISELPRKPESSYKSRIYIVPCRTCNEMVIRRYIARKATCQECKERKQYEANKNVPF